MQPLPEVFRGGLDDQLIVFDPHTETVEYAIQNHLSLRGVYFQPARSEVREDVPIVGKDDIPVVPNRVHLEMIVVAVEKGSGQFAGFPHFFHT